jgi:hypothetical protein
MKILRALCVLLLLLFVMAAGCSSTQVRKTSSGQITKEELRDQLSGFISYFKSTMNAAADEIEQKSGSKKDQMISLQMRAKVLQGLYTMSQQDDAVVAFIDTWAFCSRFRIYLEDGDGANLFGVNHTIAMDAAKRIESQIADIGRLFLSEKDFQISQKNISEFARANPIKANFTNVVAYASPATGDKQNPFAQIIGIPMVPFRGIEGVERTASAIGKFTDTADRFSGVVADLPESSRWQLLLFMYELGESEMAKSLVSSTATLSDSSKRLADSSDQLPQRLREELSLFVNEIDQKQANLQATLVQADKTAAAVSAALGGVKEAAGSIDAAAKSVTGTAKAWQDAAGATGDTFKEIAKMKPAGQAESSLSVKDIQDIAEKVTQTAGQLRETVADLNNLSGILVWRVIQIIAAILFAALIYRVAVIKMTKARGPKKPDA